MNSDLAFNWHDKEGCTLLSRLADSFKMDEDGREVIANLKTVHPMPLDSYLPFESKDGGYTVTVMKKTTPRLMSYSLSEFQRRRLRICVLSASLLHISGKHTSMAL